MYLFRLKKVKELSGGVISLSPNFTTNDSEEIFEVARLFSTIKGRETKRESPVIFYYPDIVSTEFCSNSVFFSRKCEKVEYHYQQYNNNRNNRGCPSGLIKFLSIFCNIFCLNCPSYRRNRLFVNGFFFNFHCIHRFFFLRLYSVLFFPFLLLPVSLFLQSIILNSVEWVLIYKNWINWSFGTLNPSLDIISKNEPEEANKGRKTKNKSRKKPHHSKHFVRQTAFHLFRPVWDENRDTLHIGHIFKFVLGGHVINHLDHTGRDMRVKIRWTF